jgi:hypothetical protein
MKRCPTCNREYADDGLSFCLDDGAKLNQVSDDPQATLMISPENLPTFPQTPRQTDPNRGAPQPQQPPFPSSRTQPTQQGGGWTPPPQSVAPSVTPPARKRSALPWVIGGLAVVVVGAIGVILLIFVIAALSSNNNNNNNRGIVINKGDGDNSSNPTPTATPTPTPSTKVVTGKDGVAQITIPEDWQEVTGLNANATIQVSNAPDGMYAIVISDTKADLSSSMTLDKYADLSSRKLTGSLTNLTETGPDSITINGEQALLYEIHGEISNLRAAYLFAMVETSGHFYQIGTWTTESKFADRRATMMSIIESLREK